MSSSRRYETFKAIVGCGIWISDDCKHRLSMLDVRWHSTFSACASCHTVPFPCEFLAKLSNLVAGEMVHCTVSIITWRALDLAFSAELCVTILAHGFSIFHGWWCAAVVVLGRIFPLLPQLQCFLVDFFGVNYQSIQLIL
jgi:hypothetical protein